MYLVRFFNDDEQLSIFSNVILNDGNHLMITYQENIKTTLLPDLLNFEMVEICVKSDDKPSTILCSKIWHVDLNVDTIKVVFDVDDCEEIVDRHILERT